MINQELTSVQEDLIIEDYREYIREQEDEKSQVWYDNWLDENKSDLQNDFIESNGDSFKDFCKEIFQNEVCKND